MPYERPAGPVSKTAAPKGPWPVVKVCEGTTSGIVMFVASRWATPCGVVDSSQPQVAQQMYVSETSRLGRSSGCRVTEARCCRTLTSPMLRLLTPAMDPTVPLGVTLRR